jgi:hypothetical protein
MLLEELISQITDFDAQSPREKMRLFAWWLHAHAGKEIFEPSDIKACYDKLYLSQINIALNLGRMADSKPPDLLRERKGFKLARAARTELDAKYGVHDSVVAVSKILTDLPAKVPNIEERVFLQEALKCYRHEAYRACIVMVWNLAYSHLLDWILKEPARLASFNATIGTRYPSLKKIQVTKYDDFMDEIKEGQVIDIASSAGMFSDAIYKTLKGKLDRRNVTAHPNTTVVVQSQADDMVTDLVHNVVLVLN